MPKSIELKDHAAAVAFSTSLKLKLVTAFISQADWQATLAKYPLSHFPFLARTHRVRVNTEASLTLMGEKSRDPG